MTKQTFDIVALKTLSDMISEGWDHNPTNLEHVLTTEHGAKFYVRSGKAYLNLNGLKISAAEQTPHATLMYNWANKARREILKAG
jgi:hypothetical protein